MNIIEAQSQCVERKSLSNCRGNPRATSEYRWSFRNIFLPCKKKFGPWCCQGIAKNRRGMTVSWIQLKFFLKMTFMSSGTDSQYFSGQPQERGKLIDMEQSALSCPLCDSAWNGSSAKKQPSPRKTAKKQPCTLFAHYQSWNKWVLLPQFLMPDTSWSSEAVV